MAYVRIKKIRNKKTNTTYEYAYLVSNKWKKKGARQKVKQYLGKVLRPQKQELTFEEFAQGSTEEFIRQKSVRTIITELVKWELQRHEITLDINWKTGTITKNNQPIAIAMNEGNLNIHTLKQLLYFKPLDDDRETGVAFASAFVHAGIEVPQDIFVHIFSQLILEDQII